MKIISFLKANRIVISIIISMILLISAISIMFINFNNKLISNSETKQEQLQKK